MAQWAIAWCLKHPAVTCVIPGVKNADQVRSNAAASELQFD
jgi:aryl-alcohol dehydrogenase-like predicted oxidoreductase